MRRVFGCLVAVLLAVIVVGLGAVSFAVVSGWRLIPVLSGSMTPVLSPADLVVARPLPAKDISTGSIIIYRAPVEGAPTIIHRVSSVRREADRVSFVTKGDANVHEDRWVAEMSGGSVYETVGSVSALGRPVNWIAAAGTFWMSALIVTVAIVVFLLAVIWMRPLNDVSTGKDHANLAT